MPSSLDVWQYITQWRSRSEFMVGGVELKSKLKYSFLVDTKCGQYQSQKTMHISCNRIETFLGKIWDIAVVNNPGCIKVNVHFCILFWNCSSHKLKNIVLNKTCEI